MSISNEIIPFNDQNYEELKSSHDRSNLFTDPTFPAIETSIQFSRGMNLSGVRWLRPFEVSQSPSFHESGFSRLDLDQGQLGNCWFIAACATIVQSDKIFARVVPDDQGDFNSDTYAGIFHFRFWSYGTWVDVVVDDRLPFTADGKLLFCSNKQSPDEYWASLLEKAYAKLYGSYESLDAGQTTDALIDMTGGIQEQFDLKKLSSTDRTHFWTYLEKGFELGALMGCYIAADPSVREARLSNGLVRGHAYSITSVRTVGSNQLVRIRNPWGNDVEWKGAWSDGSREWSSLSQEELDELEYQAAKDGEFWMSLNDFMTNWDGVQICHLSCDSFSAELLEQDDDSDLIWKCKTYHGAWVPGTSAGGCGQSNQAKFWTNPQYAITLTDVDDNDNENMATLFVSLMQKDSRLKRMENKSDSCEEYIQFRVFRIKGESEGEEAISTGAKLYSSQLERVGNSGSYINSREITKRFRLEPGKYLVIPSTYEENRACEFMLRLFTQHPMGDAGELDQDKDDLNYDDVHYDPQPGDQTYTKWKCFLNPTLYKKVFKVGKDLHKLINSQGGLDPTLARSVLKDGMDILQNDLGGLNMNDVKEMGDKFKKGFGKFFK